MLGVEPLPANFGSEVSLNYATDWLSIEESNLILSYQNRTDPLRAVWPPWYRELFGDSKGIRTPAT